MKILVTGSSGFIGTRFCELFPGKVFKLSKVSSVVEIVEKLKEVNPDCVVHLAGRFIGKHTSEDIDSLIDSNIKFGAKVLEAMKECGINRIVTAQTYWQHYDYTGYNPVNLYAATKQAFEDILDYYCETHGFSAAAMVLHDTYGPNDYRKKLFSVLSEMNEIKIPHDDRMIDFVHVDDVCNAISLAVEDTRGRTGKKRYVVSTRNPVTLATAIQIWSEVTGNDIMIVRSGSLGRDMRYPVEGQWVSGWKPAYNLAEGLMKTYQ